MVKNTNTSRRSFLSGTVALAGAAAIQAVIVTTDAKAQAKVPQAAVKYQATPNADQRCENCLQFAAPNSCAVVDGTISPSGWCLIWVKKS